MLGRRLAKCHTAINTDMKKLVIIPGGFHPFHGGHMALYDSALEAFPTADVFVAATADTSNRPFPFKLKKLLAQAAGVPGNRFIQVKSPFRAEEITQMYDANDTALLFVRSEKDKGSHPKPGGMRRDGSPAYLQPYRRNKLEPMSEHGYMAYLPTVQFGPGMTSATEIRSKWPDMTTEQKIELMHQLYPTTEGNDDMARKLVTIFDSILGPTVQETMMGTALGAGAGTLNPTGVSMPNDGVDEAVLVNDPEQGHLIIPDGGMGTWTEDTLRSNLARKFADMLQMVKDGQYKNLHHVLYDAGVVENMVTALQQYDRWRERQGGRPVARGREIDLAADFVEEKKHSQ